MMLLLQYYTLGQALEAFLFDATDFGVSLYASLGTRGVTMAGASVLIALLVRRFVRIS